MLGWLKKTFGLERRAAGSGFTSEIIAARESYISGRRGLAELTATAQSCVSLWEGGLAMADVNGTDMLTRRVLSLMGRSLAVRGESVWLIRETGLVPCSDWDLRTRHGVPSAYRLSVPEAGGGTTQTALAGEVLHVRLGCDVAAPWFGTAPLKRAQLTASLLHAIESALEEVYALGPLGSSIVPYPESEETDMEALGRSFRGRRGRVLLRESVNVSAAGGPAPAADWRPQSVTPDIEKAMTTESLSAARDGIMAVYGVLPGLFNSATTGPMVREAQRHLAVWQLAPIAKLIAEEASLKLGGAVELDPVRALQAWDSGGRARTVSALIGAMAQAKEAGLSPGDLGAALRLVDWEQ